MKHYVIYVPGLGDRYFFRDWLVSCWQIFGIKTELVPMNWESGEETYDQKEKRLIRAISDAQNAGYTVSLVGESAGSATVLNVAAQVTQIHRIVTIAGVNSSDLPIGPVTRKRSPSFVVAAAKVNNSLQRIDTSRIHTVRALIDHTVSPRYNDIAGARTHRVFGIGHVPTIILCLSIFSPYIIRLIKNGNKTIALMSKLC